MTINNGFFGPRDAGLSVPLSLQNGKFHGKVFTRPRSPIKSNESDSAIQDRKVLRLAKVGGILSHVWEKK